MYIYIYIYLSIYISISLSLYIYIYTHVYACSYTRAYDVQAPPLRLERCRPSPALYHHYYSRNYIILAYGDVIIVDMIQQEDNSLVSWP